MGGIAIVGAAVDRATSSRTSATSAWRSRRSGWTLLDPDRRARRSSASSTTTSACAPAGTSGCASAGKTLGIVAVARCSRGSRIDFAHVVDAPVVHPAARLRPRRPSGGSCWAVLVVYATANAVNLTDGLDGLAAGSSAFMFAAFMIIAFTEFRHRRSTACQQRAGARPGDRRGRDVRRVRGLPLVERGARAHHHGRHRLARDRRRDGGPRAADAHARCCCRSSPVFR